MRLPLVLAVLVSAVAALVLSGCKPAAEAAPNAPIELTYASPYPPTHPFSQADIEWMHEVEKRSGGRLRFKPYWAGSLLSSDMSMVEIRHGLADIGLITPIYSRGNAHMLRVQAGFYGGIRTIADQVAVYDCLAGEFAPFRDETAGLHVLAVQGGNFPGILTRHRPVRTLADLKGLRLRAQTDAIDVLRDLGADPVNMPMGEVYSALAKGVIDGVVAPADTIKSLHFAEVADHFTTLRFSRGAYPARAMSDMAWRRLPPDLQALVMAAKPFWEAALERQLLKAEADGLAFGRSHKVDIIDLAPGEQARFDTLYNRFALSQAQDLSRYGLNGPPVLARAQSLIAGGAKPCPASPDGVPR